MSPGYFWAPYTRKPKSKNGSSVPRTIGLDYQGNICCKKEYH